MLAAEPNLSGVYFVDEHFMPYSGAKPVGVRAGTPNAATPSPAGSTPPSATRKAGRSASPAASRPAWPSPCPATLDQLRAIAGPDAPILLGFDRGGAYPAAFRACRKRGAHWITYRRAPLAAPTGLPIHTTITHPRRKPVTVAYADETVTINNYGQARQITLFEHGQPVLQILTSDTTTCPAALILFMRARWRIENLFKYLDFYGIDYLADYHAAIEANTRKIDNPERKTLKAELKDLTTERDRLRERIGALHTDRAVTIAELNRQSTTAQRRIHTLDKQIADITERLKTVPAKLPANVIDPDAARADPPHPPPRPADGATPARRQRRELARPPPQRLPARQRRIPRHHPQPAPPRRHHHLHRPRPSTSNSTSPTPRDSPEPSPCSSTRSTRPTPRIPGDPRPLTYTLKA